VPADTPGVKVLRAMQVYGHDEAPHGHMHIRFSNVRVPVEYTEHESKLLCHSHLRLPPAKRPE